MAKVKDPLHGMTLETILKELVEHHGWEEMGRRIEIRCFTHEPSLKSSLTFLRRNPWARTHVETLYLELLADRQSQQGEAERDGTASG
ncbi:MAG: DUF2132 domain-containing protein [Methylotenera sp.]|nr:DUF2132 domain-containing protein [Oligoflexia bacterium]